MIYTKLTFSTIALFCVNEIEPRAILALVATVICAIMLLASDTSLVGGHVVLVGSFDSCIMF